MRRALLAAALLALVRPACAWTVSANYSWYVHVTCCGSGGCSSTNQSDAGTVSQGGLTGGECSEAMAGADDAMTMFNNFYSVYRSVPGCTVSADFKITNLVCTGFDGADTGFSFFNRQGAFDLNGLGGSQFTPHYTSDFDEWSTDAMARWNAFRRRNEIIKEEGINIWPDGRIGGLVEGFYKKVAGNKQSKKGDDFGAIDGKDTPESSKEYEAHYVDYEMLKASDPQYDIKDHGVGDLVSGNKNVCMDGGAPEGGSIPPSYSMAYSSMHGGQAESTALKVQRYPDGRAIYTDGDNVRWTYRPYGAPELAKGDSYYKPPLGATARLVYGGIHGGRGYRVESPDGDIIEFAASASSATWLPSRYNAADGSWLTYEQGPNGLARITDMHGRYFAFERDAKGLPLTVTDEQGRKTTFKYDAAGRATEVLHPDGYRKRFAYDAAGFMSSVKNGVLAEEHYTYDAQGRLLTSESDGGVNRLEHYYDDASSKTIITDAFGARTTYVYKNEAGRKLTTSITDALGGTAYLGYDASYNVAVATDALGRATKFIRNNNGDPEQVTDAIGNTSAIEYQVKLKYRDAGGDKTDYYSRPVKITDALGRITKLDYDSYGNLSKAVDAQGNKTSMAYDKAGHMLELRDALGSTYKYEYTMGLTRSVDPLGHVTKYKRDADLHVTQLTDPLGRNTTFTYDLSGNVTSVTNPMGHATRFAYGNGACPSCGGSQLSALTDPKGNTWSFNYDQYGRLTNTANPLGQAKAYAYDKMSRVAEVKDPAGNVTQYTYDALNRLTRKDIQTTSGTHSITDYSYDAVGNLLSIANGGSAVSYTYDQVNRPVSTTQSFDGKAYTLDYAYDAVGNRTAMATPWGKYSYTYDALNRLTGIVNPQGITVAFGYDAAGRRTSKKVFKAAPAVLAEAEYNYDAAGQLTEIVNKAGGKVVAFNKYQYDANGNRTRIEDQDGIWDYKYDAANRLIVAIPWPVDYVKAEAFVYDKNGNRRYDKTAWDYHYDAANRLLENSTYTYTHDANGNLTEKTNRFDNTKNTYAYTPEQQLSEVTTPEHKVQYKYDPLGRRTGKVVDGRTIKFVYDGQDIIAELDDAGNQINIYTNGPGIDEPLVMTKPDGNAYYYHADALGSVKAITDDNAKIIETYKYKAYGQPTIKGPKGQPLVTSIIGNTRMFAAREYEQEIGLYNNRRRYLDPSRGAFTQEDPIGFEGGTLNLYSYVNLSPAMGFDPLGLKVRIIIIRDTLTDESATGTIYVASDLIPDRFIGYTLEPIREKSFVLTGDYRASIRTNHSPNRVELINVPGNSHIQIHVGNSPEDSQGCFLVGKGRTIDFVSDSVNAMKSILNVIKKDASGVISVTVLESKAFKTSQE